MLTELYERSFHPLWKQSTGNNIKKSIENCATKKNKGRGREEGNETIFFRKKKKNRQQSIYAHRFKAKRDTTMTRFIPQFHTARYISHPSLPSPYFDFFARSRRTGGKGIFNNNACQKSSRQRHRHSAPANIAQTF